MLVRGRIFRARLACFLARQVLKVARNARQAGGSARRALVVPLRASVARRCSIVVVFVSRRSILARSALEAFAETRLVAKLAGETRQAKCLALDVLVETDRASAARLVFAPASDSDGKFATRARRARRVRRSASSRGARAVPSGATQTAQRLGVLTRRVRPAPARARHTHFLDGRILRRGRDALQLRVPPCCARCACDRFDQRRLGISVHSTRARSAAVPDGGVGAAAAGSATLVACADDADGRRICMVALGASAARRKVSLGRIVPVGALLAVACGVFELAGAAPRALGRSRLEGRGAIRARVAKPRQRIVCARGANRAVVF